MAKKSPWNNAIEEENKQNRTVASQNTIAGTRSTPWNNAVQTGIHRLRLTGTGQQRKCRELIFPTFRSLKTQL
jgi:hypothetical protein